MQRRYNLHCVCTDVVFFHGAGVFLATNARKRRSHAVLTVHLTMRTIKKSGVNADEGEHRKRQTEGEDIGQRGVGRGGGEKVTTSKLNLVDLAGSEKNATSETAGDAAILHREGSFINKSLTFLEQVCAYTAYLQCAQVVALGGGYGVEGAKSTGARSTGGRTSRCFEAPGTLRLEIICVIARSTLGCRGSVVPCCTLREAKMPLTALDALNILLVKHYVRSLCTLRHHRVKACVAFHIHAHLTCWLVHLG